MNTDNERLKKQAWLDDQLGKDCGWTVEDVVICERCNAYELAQEMRNGYCGLSICPNCKDD